MRSGVVEVAAKITCVGDVPRVGGSVGARLAKVAITTIAPESGSKRHSPVVVTMSAVLSPMKVTLSGTSPVVKVWRVLSFRLISVIAFRLGSGVARLPKWETTRYWLSGEIEIE